MVMPIGVPTLSATLLSVGMLWLWPNHRWPGFVLLSLGLLCLAWLLIRHVIDAKRKEAVNEHTSIHQPSISQTMTDSAGAIQSGRDITIPIERKEKDGGQ